MQAHSSARASLPNLTITLPLPLWGDSQPAVLFVDRGAGFWDTRIGRIRAEFQQAAWANGLRIFYGVDASKQTRNLQELLLHETAVSWMHRREETTRPTTPWRSAAKCLPGHQRQWDPSGTKAGPQSIAKTVAGPRRDQRRDHECNVNNGAR